MAAQAIVHAVAIKIKYDVGTDDKGNTKYATQRFKAKTKATDDQLFNTGIAISELTIGADKRLSKEVSSMLIG